MISTMRAIGTDRGKTWRRRVLISAPACRWCAICPILVQARFDRACRNPYHFGLDSNLDRTDSMLRVSRLVDYATMVMTCVASHPDAVLSAAQIAEETRLESPTVGKLLKALGQAGLLESFRGINGGYRLARPAREICVAEIVEAMEGPLGMTECSHAAGQCERERGCTVQGGWRRIHRALESALRAMSLADMLQPPAVVGVALADIKRRTSTRTAT
jgi:FeS assembly SUF system regulator